HALHCAAHSSSKWRSEPHAHAHANQRPSRSTLRRHGLPLVAPLPLLGYSFTPSHRLRVPAYRCYYNMPNSSVLSILRAYSTQ
ncbi:hypothetical protein COCVIDRAFT_87042, partial [Bipolaris victoriae FI3]